jgi:hypothetical protein
MHQAHIRWIVLDYEYYPLSRQIVFLLSDDSKSGEKLDCVPWNCVGAAR